MDQGQKIAAGTPITAGQRDPQDVLRVQGREAAQLYLVKEVQRVYRNTGVYIHDKHIEVIVRQMLRRVKIDDPGDTEMLPSDLVDRFVYADTNARVLDLLENRDKETIGTNPDLLEHCRQPAERSWYATVAGEQLDCANRPGDERSHIGQRNLLRP